MSISQDIPGLCCNKELLSVSGSASWKFISHELPRDSTHWSHSRRETEGSPSVHALSRFPKVRRGGGEGR